MGRPLFTAGLERIKAALTTDPFRDEPSRVELVTADPATQAQLDDLDRLWGAPW